MTNRLAFAVASLAALLASACGASVVDLVDNAAAGPRLTADADLLIETSSAAMADVTSVEFTLARSGAPVYVDEFESLELKDLKGQFVVPTRAQALLTIEVNGSLTTQLGAIAIDDTVWMSNPVTGNFEPLPVGIDLDPSKFFDPTGGWQPLLANLGDVELADGADSGPFHLRGVARPDDVAAITVGLVQNQEVPVDLWVNPVTGLVQEAEFVTELNGEKTTWHLELSRYGDPFEITAPEEVL